MSFPPQSWSYPSRVFKYSARRPSRVRRSTSIAALGFLCSLAVGLASAQTAERLTFEVASVKRSVPHNYRSEGRFLLG